MALSQNKKIRIFLVLLAVSLLAILLYIQSFDAIEPVCGKKKGSEAFLLNYVSKGGLKEKIYAHNKSFDFDGDAHRRVYLSHPILRLNYPIFGDEYDYKPEGCDGYDVMDIYCIVDFYRLEGGLFRVTYRFM